MGAGQKEIGGSFYQQGPRKKANPRVGFFARALLIEASKCLKPISGDEHPYPL